MDRPIEISILQAETIWLDALYSNAEELFQDRFLPSHDHTHHQRVWNHCKKLLTAISDFHPDLDQSLAEGALIASFFHDLGMVYSTREDHGKLGRELYEAWFPKQNKPVPDRFEEIGMAIELHDRKEKGSYPGISPEDPPRILTVLSLADDMEALGTIGIYRYAEIYLMRQIPITQLGERVLVNAAHRYHNLLENCSSCPSLMTFIQEEYALLKEFFEGMKRQLAEEEVPEQVNETYLGVINYIRSCGIEGKTQPAELLGCLKNEDPFLLNFFRTLKNELDQTHK